MKPATSLLSPQATVVLVSMLTPSAYVEAPAKQTPMTMAYVTMTMRALESLTLAAFATVQAPFTNVDASTSQKEIVIVLATPSSNFVLTRTLAITLLSLTAVPTPTTICANTSTPSVCAEGLAWLT